VTATILNVIQQQFQKL